MKMNFVLSHDRKAYIHLLIEAAVLLIIIFAFWHPTGGKTSIRESWLWLLWFAVPLFALRLAIHHRFWAETPLNFLLLAFILLSAFNFSNAPLHREGYLVLVCRPLLGIWMYFHFLEHAKLNKNLSLLVIGTIGMAFVLALTALTTTQWLPEKLGRLGFLVDALPHFDYRGVANNLDGRICIPFSALIIPDGCFNPGDVLRNTLLSFNANEIAGALAWMTPTMAAIALAYPRKEKEDQRDWLSLSIRSAAGFVFVMLFAALFLGQSRFAIAGVMISLILMVWLLVPNNRWRYLLLGVVAVLIVLQLALLLNLFAIPSSSNSSADPGLSGRDQNSVATRLEIWKRGLWMMHDYPLTGIGMAMYRTAVSRPPYQIPYYVEHKLYPPPHAHNEWIQIGADLGVPGLALYISWQIVVLQMLWYGWKSQNKTAQAIAIASFTGLLAHALYGMGDAVTLWDRYQFILWWLVGLAGAQYVLAKSEADESSDLTNGSR